MNITKLTSQAGSYTSVIHGNTCFTYEQLQKFVDIVRAETLEEAAKWFEGNEDDVGYAIATEIRGLK